MQVYGIPVGKSEIDKDLTVHGTYEFPMEMYDTALDQNLLLGYIDWHWHDDIQFCLMIKGCLDFYVEDEVYRLSEREGLFINVNPQKNYKCVKFHKQNIVDICCVR
jgi:hypothetical protein